MNSATSNADPVHSGNAKPTAERAGILFIISAPSGTGKTTLCKQLVDTVPGLWHSVSCTTRKARPGEVDGREYFFTEESIFRSMIDRNEFVEWASVYGHLYGTPERSLADKISQGIDVLLEIDVQGAMQVKNKFKNAVLIFILPPSLTVLRQRLQGRASDSNEEIQRRLQQVKNEVKNFGEYAYIVRNDDLAVSLRNLESIFLAERLKTDRLNISWIEDKFDIEIVSKPEGRKDLL